MSDGSRSRLIVSLLLLTVSGFCRAIPCEAADDTEAELRGGRFAVHVTFDDGSHSMRSANVASTGQQNAVFQFFNPANPELLVKILDGRPINGNFWVFYGAITSLAVEIEVIDRVGGTRQTYHKPEGSPQGGADVNAFADLSDLVTHAEPASLHHAAQDAKDKSKNKNKAFAYAFGTCVADDTTLCLQGGRFQIRGSWHSADAGGSADAGVAANVAESSDRSGYLWFFGVDNPEVLVKVLDGRGINGSFWVLFGSATHLPFRLEITDLETGVEKAFSGGAFGGGSDVFTLGPHGDVPQPPEVLVPADGAVVNPADPPMSSDDGAIADAADDDCYDYHIVEVTADGERLAWSAGCVDGEFRHRPHLDLGVFAGEHAATGKLSADTEHRLLVRRRRSGDPDLSGPWNARTFRTGPYEGIYPMTAEPAQSGTSWIVGGEPVRLPGDEGACGLRWEAAAPSPGSLRLVVGACGVRVTVPESEYLWRTADGRRRQVSLPALDVAAGESSRFDVATGGSTFSAADTGTPDLLDPSLLVRHASSPWWLAPGLDIEELPIQPRALGSGLTLPVNLTLGPGLFTPAEQATADDPMFYVTELYGAIRVVRRDGTLGVYADGLLNFDPLGNIPGNGEVGLVGTAVDPSNGDLLATTIYRTNPDLDEPPRYSGKVLRLPSSDGGRTAAGVETLLDLGEGTHLNRSHQISHLSFGPDGMLYVHVGDGFAAQQAQILDNFAGKILRLRPDGTAPDDNPFYDATDGISAADYVFTLGLRNPFGGDWRDADHHLYEVENGLAVDRFARMDRGTNYHWGLGDDIGNDQQMTYGAIFNWPEAVTPFDLVFIPESESGALPAEWSGLALVSEFGPTYTFGTSPRGKRLALFDLDAEPIAPRTVVRYDGQGPATIAAVTLVNDSFGYDGLYFVDFFPDQVAGEDGSTVPGARLWRVFVAEP